jgi:hypothetical protein
MVMFRSNRAQGIQGRSMPFPVLGTLHRHVQCNAAPAALHRGGIFAGFLSGGY